MISVEGLTKSYGDRGSGVAAVNELSFEVKEGEFYTLLGPSGCGKTTTLKCVAGLERADHGTIRLGDTVVVSDRVFVPTHRRDIGMVFQNYAVWPHMNAFDNVAFPLRSLGRSRSRKKMEQQVLEALELVNLRGLEDRMATQLSGGQQQRLSLARALVREPRVLLLDEPLSNLDAKLRESMRIEVSLIQRRLGITALFVTHDQAEALAMSDRIAVMRDGKIVQEGSPRAIYHEPADEFVASFVGSTNLIHGVVTEGLRRDDAQEGGLTEVETPLGTLKCGRRATGASRSVVVAVRPEDVVVHEATSTDARGRDNTYEGVVELGLFAGPVADYKISLAAGVVLSARGPSRTQMARNAPVLVELPPQVCHVLPPRESEHPAETVSASAAGAGA